MKMKSEGSWTEGIAVWIAIIMIFFVPAILLFIAFFIIKSL